MRLRPFGCIPILIVIALLLWLPLLDVSIPGMLMTLLSDGTQALMRSVIVWLTDLSGGTDNLVLQELLSHVREWLWRQISESERQVIRRFLEIRGEAGAFGGGA